MRKKGQTRKRCFKSKSDRDAMSMRLGLDTHSACTPTVDLHHDLVGTAFHLCRCPQVRTMSASAEKSISGDMAAAANAVKFEVRVSVVSELPAPPYL